jgi:hypothetical protein
MQVTKKQSKHGTGGQKMASETKTFCDRCRKEITRETWIGELILPRRIKMKVIYEGGYSKSGWDFDLCEKCMSEVLRILRGNDDGK